MPSHAIECMVLSLWWYAAKVHATHTASGERSAPVHQALQAFAGDSSVPPIGAGTAAKDTRAAFYQRRKSSLKRRGSAVSACRPPPTVAKAPVDADATSSKGGGIDKENLAVKNESGPTPTNIDLLVSTPLAQLSSPTASFPGPKHSCRSHQFACTESMLNILMIQAKPADEHWRTTLQLRKAREEAVSAKEQMDKIATEESKWVGVPAWKRLLLEAKAKRAAEERKPEREAMEKEAREAEKFRSIPAWRQQLIINKMNR